MTKKKLPKWRWALLPLSPIAMPIAFFVGVYKGIKLIKNSKIKNSVDLKTSKFSDREDNPEIEISDSHEEGIDEREVATELELSDPEASEGTDDRKSIPELELSDPEVSEGAGNCENGPELELSDPEVSEGTDSRESVPELELSNPEASEVSDGQEGVPEIPKLKGPTIEPLDSFFSRVNAGELIFLPVPEEEEDNEE